MVGARGTRMDIEQVFSRSKVNRYHIGILLMCLFVIMMEGYNLVIFGAIVSNIISEWQITTVTAGFLGSAALVGMMVGSFGLGILADTVGRKKSDGFMPDFI